MGPWEYESVNITESMRESQQRRLNELLADGWEPFQVDDDGSVQTFHLKRYARGFA